VSRVLVVSNDYARRTMAGPGIRNVELARQLAQAGNEVAVAVPVSTDLEGLPFRLDPYDPMTRLADGRGSRLRFRDASASPSVEEPGVVVGEAPLSGALNRGLTWLPNNWLQEIYSYPVGDQRGRTERAESQACSCPPKT
jgi:hypothetical protein